MSASFAEKSAWIQLVSLVVVLGGYFVVAGRMLRAGVTALPAYVPLFVVAMVLLVVVLIVGHTVAALVDRADDDDERDRLIGWRAESRASWVLGLGVLAAINGLIFSVGTAWIAHLLLLSMLLSEILKLVLQLVDYRRGF